MKIFLTFKDLLQMSIGLFNLFAILTQTNRFNQLLIQIKLESAQTKQQITEKIHYISSEVSKISALTEINLSEHSHKLGLFSDKLNNPNTLLASSSDSFYYYAFGTLTFLILIYLGSPYLTKYFSNSDIPNLTAQNTLPNLIENSQIQDIIIQTPVNITTLDLSDSFLEKGITRTESFYINEELLATIIQSLQD